MNKYRATIRIKGRSVNTVIFADSPLHARLIIEYQYGLGSVINGPRPISEADTLKPIKPLPPDKFRLASMKQQKDTLTKNIKAERDRQQIAKAQQQIFKATTQKNVA
jgi:hypothetical protein